MKMGKIINILKKTASPEDVLISFMKEMNDDNYAEIFSKMYKYVKSITNTYCLTGDGMHSYYYYLLDQLLACEKKFKNDRSLDVPLNLDAKRSNEFLDSLVYCVRKDLIRELYFQGYRGKVQDMNFTNQCLKSSMYVKDFCEVDNTECYTLAIYPGYDTNTRLFEGGGCHFASIVKYNGGYYLIDLTYSQFFYKVRENLDRMGIVDLSCCNMGTFVLMDAGRMSVAKKLLADGYIKLTANNFKQYLDPFTISFRNGLYYEEFNDFSYTTPYTVDDYIRFLKREDSQIEHEGQDNLGYQKRPLKNWEMDFRKR